jgi:hypothetical protein
MVDQRIREPDRSEKIGPYRLFRIAELAIAGQVLPAHDTGVVDKHIERRMLGNHLPGEGDNGVRIFDIEGDCVHSVSTRDGLVKRLLAAPRDNHRIAECMESRRQFSANAGPSAGDENRVARQVHRSLHSS